MPCKQLRICLAIIILAAITYPAARVAGQAGTRSGRGASPGRGAGPAVAQWPNYQHNSNFSPLTQITPANVSQLTLMRRIVHRHAGRGNYNSTPL